ncbi:RNA polymerase sigma-54 factor [Candidatus Sumerlaeota bacterium]|nr:RNA polymerase sigma-54 factor [Candidatus Sumerlaeota bacterium]
MAQTLSMQQTQSQQQRLIMTQQMQQSIQLLQMTTQELEQHIEQELMENPFLTDSEEEEADASSLDKEPQADKDEADTDADADSGDAAAEERAAGVDDDVNETHALDDPEKPETFDDVDAEWDDVFDPFQSQTKYRGLNEAPDDDQQDFTEYTALGKSLYDHLDWQLRVSGLDGEKFEAARYLIYNVDENGFLRVSVEEAAEDLKLPVDLIEEVLEICQEFEPTGVLARDEEECLRLQLEEMNVRDLLVYRILEHDFVDLQKGRYRELARKYNVDISRIQEVRKHITRCDPKPGRSITKDQVQYITPDVYVTKTEYEDGDAPRIQEYEKQLAEGIYNRLLYLGPNGRVVSEYMIDLRESHNTRLLHIDNYYRNIFQSNNGFNKEEAAYAKEKYNAANWLIKNIQKRKSTIIRVAWAIMNHQIEFLEKGIDHLRPLTLKDIAAVVEMHESTVARVTSGKYVETPRGVFELKYFFSSQLETDDGDAASSRSVKNLIREAISAEDPKKPLSDLKITRMLNDRGIQIARRTVAKYREQLKILPAKLRKER